MHQTLINHKLPLKKYFFDHRYQRSKNCAPSQLSITLSHWRHRQIVELSHVFGTSAGLLFRWLNFPTNWIVHQVNRQQDSPTENIDGQSEPPVPESYNSSCNTNRMNSKPADVPRIHQFNQTLIHLLKPGFLKENYTKINKHYSTFNNSSFFLAQSPWHSTKESSFIYFYTELPSTVWGHQFFS